jgi:ribosomal protein S6E (S10)
MPDSVLLAGRRAPHPLISKRASFQMFHSKLDGHRRRKTARGLLLGMALGAGMWAGIFGLITVLRS